MNVSDARSRGISGVSGDLNLALNQTQASHSSNENFDQNQCRSTVADKVRGVRFAGRPESPSDREANYVIMTSDLEESKKDDNVEDKDQVPSPNNLSPYQERVANRRSHSFCREARSPSWNKADFNSSAMSDSKNTAELKSSCAGISEKDLSQLNLSHQEASQELEKNPLDKKYKLHNMTHQAIDLDAFELEP